MRIRYSLGIFLALASANGMAVYGCSAGANDPATDTEAGAGDQDATVDNEASTGDDEGGQVAETGPKADSGPKDAGLDAKLKPDVGLPGTPCNPIGQNQNNPNGCGLCGTQSRVCLQGDAGAGIDAGVWSDWGACTNEVTTADKCDPSVADAGVEVCGNCGHRQVICQLDCHKNETLVCQGEPLNACTPGDTKFTLAQGCPNANQGRSQSCGNDCMWGPPSGCIDPPPNPNTINMSPTVNTVVSKTFALAANKTIAKLGISSCPTTIGTDITPYIYVQVNNPDSAAHSVEVWGSVASGGPVIDTIMGAYGAVVPQSPTDRQACTGAVKDTCASTTPALSPACSGQWAGLVGTNAVSVPAGGSVQVYMAAYYDGSGGETITGNFQLNVRTK